MIIYLNDVPEGGETIFPLVLKNASARHGRSLPEFIDARSGGAAAMPKSLEHDPQMLGMMRYQDCVDPARSRFLTVKPRKGAAVLFYTQRPKAGHLDVFSLHGSCPTKGGHEKWIAQQWIHKQIEVCVSCMPS